MNSFIHTSHRNDNDHARLEIIKRNDQGATAALTYIRDIYQRRYNAEITPNPDLLISRRDRTSGTLTACAGISFASPTNQLFSERYFDSPVESVLELLTQRVSRREQIVEIGSLASDDPNAAAEIIRALPILTWFMGVKAILCTSTRRLRTLFEYHGIPLRIIGDADINRLSALERQQWGSYYAQSPKTGVILLEECSHLFNQFCGRLTFSAFEHLTATTKQIAA
ncbi:thermostable hemolysin [Pseudomonas brassicacearum]|uniref:Thermostable hemolysin n=1 Tax=Pseudomonas brassicacearum TaxID=930166 RepID=A0A423GRS8_9PSED|nr:thermostable hemolysin [Pseudomonas brassicacearum]ROM97172.1 hypothetical protein BK658_13140 [Pseudomonas brassicacearum]